MKRVFSFFLILFICSLGFSQVLNDAEIINPKSNLYEQIKNLQMENQILFFTQNTPVSVGEIKMYLRELDYENLSDNSKSIYDKLNYELNTSANLLSSENLQLYTNLKTTGELYYKTNKNIPWTNKYNFVDNLITVPIHFGFGNMFYLSSDLFVGKNDITFNKPSNFTNIPLKIKDLEFNFPKYSYGSVGKTFDDWGYNFHFGKEGKTIGDTISGSILYNSTFETDGYGEFVLYSQPMKYTLDFIQISSNRMDTIQNENTERYMYIHQFDIRLFKKSKISVFEASMVANPFSIRYLNPFVIMHQYGGWTNYVNKNDINGDSNYNIYKETNFCAYFAGMFESVPFSNLRLYGIYSQIEMQTWWERSQSRGKYYPNSFAMQTGGEYNLYVNGKLLNIGLEGVYTSPFMYMKQTPSASLYRFRIDMQTKQPVYSWIGTPFGPDCLAGQVRAKYNFSEKLKFEFDYVLSMKGMNDFSTFNNVTEDGIYSYYPSVIWYLIKNEKSDMSYDELYKKTMALKITGIPVIKNQFGIQGEYIISDHFDLNAKIVYINVINNNHIKNDKENGCEFSVSLSYKLF